MPRIARGLWDGLIYHVLNRGNGGQLREEWMQKFHTELGLKATIRERGRPGKVEIK